MPADRLAFLSQKLLSCQSIYWIRRAAFRAGNQPNKIPVAVEQETPAAVPTVKNQSPSRVRKAQGESN